MNQKSGPPMPPLPFKGPAMPGKPALAPFKPEEKNSPPRMASGDSPASQKPTASPLVPKPESENRSKTKSVRVQMAASPSLPPQKSSGEIVFTTMQNDLEAIKSGKDPGRQQQTRGKTSFASTATSSKSFSPLKNAASGQPVAINGSKSEGSDKSSPLAPAANGGAAGTAAASIEKKGVAPRIVSPPLEKKKKVSLKTILAAAIAVMLLSAAAGAAVYWKPWTLLADPNGKRASNEGERAASAEVLPSQAGMVIQYLLSTTESRSDILTAWSANGASPTFSRALEGDPRIFAETAGIEEFYYVLLPENPQLFFLTPDKSEAQQLLDSHGASYAVHKGWIVAHSLDPSIYLGSLQNSGSLDSSQDGSLFEAENSSGQPIKISLGPGVLMQLRESSIGEGFENGQISSFNLAGKLSASGSLEVSGTASRLASHSSGQADQEQLLVVPDNAAYIHLGSNFYEDVGAWSKSTNASVGQTLSQPAVQSLLAQLTSAYALYTDNSAQGSRSFGLVIEVPDNINLTLGDSALETAMSAFMPLLTGRVPATELSFSDAKYQEIPLRYVNISGSPYALDYTVTDNYLLIATSKDGAFRLLDTVIGTWPKNASDSSLIQSLMSEWGALPVSAEISIGVLDHPLLRGVLPGVNDSNGIGYALALDPQREDGATLNVAGILKPLTSGTDTATGDNGD